MFGKLFNKKDKVSNISNTRPKQRIKSQIVPKKTSFNADWESNMPQTLEDVIEKSNKITEMAKLLRKRPKNTALKSTAQSQRPKSTQSQRPKSTQYQRPKSTQSQRLKSTAQSQRLNTAQSQRLKSTAQSQRAQSQRPIRKTQNTKVPLNPTITHSDIYNLIWNNDTTIFDKLYKTNPNDKQTIQQMKKSAQKFHNSQSFAKTRNIMQELDRKNKQNAQSLDDLKRKAQLFKIKRKV